jgi:hypothetical protein
MKFMIDLSPVQAEQLRREAERLGLTPEDLARAAVADLLATPHSEFRTAAERVLRKNEELTAAWLDEISHALGGGRPARPPS